MRKLAAGLTILALGLAGSVTVVEEAYAAPATPPTLSLDCTNSADFTTSLASINANRVISGARNDTFTISNIASSGNCTVVTNAGIIREDGTDEIIDLTIVPGATRTYELRSSGSFTIAPAGGSAVTFVSDTCTTLSGSGIPADPWLLGTVADFEQIALEPTKCTLGGSYRQTANVVLDRYLHGVAGVFSGTFDGDHYSITLTGEGFDGWAKPGTTDIFVVGFFEQVSGTVQKVRLRGSLFSASQTVGGLAKDLLPGAVISEVDVALTIRVTGANTAYYGMIASEISEGARLQYVRAAGRIEYAPSIAPGQVAIGGLVGATDNPIGSGGPKFAEIRDSYSTTTIEWNAAAQGAVYAGGLVGWVGHVVTDTDATLRIIRSYASPTFRPANPIPSSTDNTVLTPPMVGGLIGRHDSASTVAASSFYNADSGAAFAIAYRQPRTTPSGLATDFVGYDGSDLPQAPRVSAANLRTLSTYQTSELQTPSNSGLPGGAEIVQADSGEAVTGDTRAATAPDYRWAIEPGNQVGFVATDYRIVSNFASRKLFPDPVLAATYQTRGVVGTVSSYPRLGRVWEICANENNGFPVLVWEELDCSAPGGDGDAGGNPGGLSSAEYAEFLRSGLTLADFLARRLAATGPSDAALGLGGLSAVLLGLVGAALVLIARRQVSRKPR